MTMPGDSYRNMHPWLVWNVLRCLKMFTRIYGGTAGQMHLYQHGMDLTLISQWLGHASLEVTLVYAHADTEKKREAINKAMENTSLSTPDAAVFKVDDDELLKKLCGLK